MSKNWLETDQINNFPKGVRSVYVNGRRVKKQDVEIERSFLEVSSSNYDISNIPEHINYLPKKQAAEYLGISESTLTRYHVKGKLKWIQEEIELQSTREKHSIILRKKIKENYYLRLSFPV